MSDNFRKYASFYPTHVDSANLRSYMMHHLKYIGQSTNTFIWYVSPELANPVNFMEWMSKNIRLGKRKPVGAGFYIWGYTEQDARDAKKLLEDYETQWACGNVSAIVLD